ncbi:LrgB family protein [Thauera linaloolentis]|uniref:LrgB family protein n=1 Tax=Thauera linaloolentis (strain DSM 12138 / JCM 21573 / CCUG 41526 / CIP 105981 / IAM 15112 / NBRC 102519 / 47Lol) TaxID=1123367 RepID=N6ZBA1_THAL4|nr:LrgB family protein [Thauera linaloolentis]ENO89459.1 LrgB family protein [Thauera linaloolentis 47Lol = DSM 12138]MCM8566904.1 LrgB family protein [Thauera linaloolentis]
MTPRLTELWVYLSASPLLGLTLTLVAYQAAHWLYKRAGYHPLANPVMIAITIVTAVLFLSGMDYRAYFDGAQFVHFLLGPATVALAIPLHAQWPRLKAMAGPLVIALVVGSLTAALSAYGIGALLGASRPTLMSLAPKSVTTPIAMAVAEPLGGLPALAAAMVILTGVLGAICGPYLYRWLRIGDHAIRGFAIGLASHGIGTARAFQVSEQAGAFAALAMGLNGLLTALSLPWIMPWLERLGGR